MHPLQGALAPDENEGYYPGQEHAGFATYEDDKPVVTHELRTRALRFRTPSMETGPNGVGVGVGAGAGPAGLNTIEEGDTAHDIKHRFFFSFYSSMYVRIA